MERLVNANAEWKFFFNAIGTAFPGKPIQVQYVVRSIQCDMMKNVRKYPKMSKNVLKCPKMFSNLKKCQKI